MKEQNRGETSVQMDPPPSAEHSFLPTTPSIEAQEGGELPEVDERG